MSYTIEELEWVYNMARNHQRNGSPPLERWQIEKAVELKRKGAR